MCGKGRTSFKDARLIAAASHIPGASPASVKRLAEIGTKGQWSQNLERDAHRMAQKVFGIPDVIYKVKVPMMNPCTAKIKETWCGLLLPHELFGMIGEHCPELFKQLFCHELDKFWVHMFRVDDGWLRGHPLRDVIRLDLSKASAYCVGSILASAIHEALRRITTFRLAICTFQT